MRVSFFIYLKLVGLLVLCIIFFTHAATCCNMLDGTATDCTAVSAHLSRAVFGMWAIVSCQVMFVLMSCHIAYGAPSASSLVSTMVCGIVLQCVAFFYTVLHCVALRACCSIRTLRTLTHMRMI